MDRQARGADVQLFEDRTAAGRALAEQVAAVPLVAPVVLALPRGGVPVGAEVARRLAAQFDVLVVRKIGAPFQPELGLGALAEGGGLVLDQAMLAAVGLQTDQVSQIIEREEAELARRIRAYRDERPLPPVAGRDAILVDDGLATGGTARAGLRALRGQGARRTILAVPVAPPQAVAALKGEADDIVALRTPLNFRSVGRWYARFPQLTDDEVLDVLSAAGAGGCEDRT